MSPPLAAAVLVTTLKCQKFQGVDWSYHLQEVHKYYKIAPKLNGHYYAPIFRRVVLFKLVSDQRIPGNNQHLDISIILCNFVVSILPADVLAPFVRHLQIQCMCSTFVFQRNRYLECGKVIASHCILQDSITYPCLRYLPLAPMSSYSCGTSCNL